MEMAGIWSYGNVNNLVMTQDDHQLVVNWLADNASWKVSTGTVDGYMVRMSFDNGATRDGELSNDGKSIIWDNNTRWNQVPMPH